MDEVSPMLSRRTTKTRADIFGAIRSVGQREIAAQLGISESSLSDFGRKTVPTDVTCLGPTRIREIEDEFQRLHYWASKGMASQKAVQIADPEEVDTGIHWDVQ